MTYKAIFLFFAFIAMSVFVASASAEVNDSDTGFEVRGAFGGGNIFWGYVSHSNSSGDLGTGKGATFNFAGMYNYSIAAVEFNLLYGNINDLEWSDEDDSGVSHDWKSSGNGYYVVYDLKLGAKLFTDPGDMGYTYFYGGLRWWNTERNEDSIEYDGTSLTYENKYKAKGNGWILGYRDISTIGPDNAPAFMLQSGFFIGKAPVDKISRNGVDQTQSVDSSISFGGELAGGVALQNLGLSVVGGLRGEVNFSTLTDPNAPEDEESVFGFGNFTFFAEAGMQF